MQKESGVYFKLIMIKMVITNKIHLESKPNAMASGVFFIFLLHSFSSCTMKSKRWVFEPNSLNQSKVLCISLWETMLCQQQKNVLHFRMKFWTRLTYIVKFYFYVRHLHCYFVLLNLSSTFESPANLVHVLWNILVLFLHFLLLALGNRKKKHLCFEFYRSLGKLAENSNCSSQ